LPISLEENLSKRWNLVKKSFRMGKEELPEENWDSSLEKEVLDKRDWIGLGKNFSRIGG